MPDETSPEKAQADESKTRRRGRRGGRGRRGARPRAPLSAPAQKPSTTDQADLDPQDAEVAVEEAADIAEPAGEPLGDPSLAEAPLPDSPLDEQRREVADAEVLRHGRAAPREQRRDFRPAPPAAIIGAIEDVNRCIASLRQVLDTMEEILETLELAEVQKNADERDIEVLRRQIRSLDRGGSRPPQPHSSGRDRDTRDRGQRGPREERSGRDDRGNREEPAAREEREPRESREPESRDESRD